MSGHTGEQGAARLRRAVPGRAVPAQAVPDQVSGPDVAEAPGGGRPAREWTVAAVGSVLLAAVMTWPTLLHPMRTIPQDTGDPTLQAWQVAWTGHALRTNPANLWHGNVSFPERYTLAYSDSLLGYAPLGMIGSGPSAAVLRYNVLFVLAFALAFFGAYALLRQLGTGRVAAVAAGVAFSFNPWRLSQGGHLQVLSSGGMLLALAMLARGHGWSMTGGYVRDRVRPGWALAGWSVAAWQITLGFGLGIPFGYVVLGIALVGTGVWLRHRPRLPRRLLGADALGGLAFTGTVLAMMYPYLQVLHAHPEVRRTVDWLKPFSPPLRGFVTASAESWLWGESHAAARHTLGWPPEMTLLPGFFLIGLAGVGLFVSIWSVRQRAFLAAGVVVTGWLAMGTAAPGGGRYGYLLIYRLPGFDAIRTPGRLVVWTILLLAILAAGAVASVPQHAAPPPADQRSDPWVRALITVPILALLLEGAHHTPHPDVPSAPPALATVADPVLVLPSDGSIDASVMLWSTDGFPRTVNGASSLAPPLQVRIREATTRFPDPASVALLREVGVRTVIVLRGRIAGTPYASILAAPAVGAGVTREDRGDVVVFTIS